MRATQVAEQGPVKAAVTAEDVEKVQFLIESCLQRFMTLEQTCDTLALISVDRRFTQLVWRRLEAENREFFENYYKMQIQSMASCLQALDMSA